MPAEALRPAYETYLGKNVSQADLAAIAANISERYRYAGYHLSRAIVPVQDIEAGRVRITMIEGSITEIALKGDGADRFGIKPMLDAIVAERPSRLATLERQLLLINDRPGARIVDTTLEEIGGPTGNFRLTVEVKTWQVYTSFGLDNLGSSAVGPWQTYATGAFNSYLLPGDTLALNLSTIPDDPRELAFGRLSYDVPIGTDGFRIGASTLYSEVRPGDYRRQWSDKTTTESIEIRGSIIPLQSQKSTLTLTLAAGASNVSESDVYGTLYQDHLRTIALSADYRMKDNFGGNNYLTLAWRQGLDILGASHRDDWVSHDGASGEFGLLNLWFTRYQSLSDSWSVKISTAAQVASAPLLTSQQFYLGGAAFGRGYGSAQISGDNALAGSAELRFDQDVSYAYLKSLQFYGFVESGAVWNVGYSLNDGASLTSAGGGLRFFFNDDLRADIGVAFPLTFRAFDNPDRNPRLLFSLTNALKFNPSLAQLQSR